MRKETANDWAGCVLRKSESDKLTSECIVCASMCANASMCVCVCMQGCADSLTLLSLSRQGQSEPPKQKLLVSALKIEPDNDIHF